MMKIGSRFLAATLALLLVPAPGSAQDHVVSAADVHARLLASAADRAAGLRAVDAALATPAAEEAAALLHTDVDRMRRGVASLTDEELRDVAARAELLTVDPVAGLHPLLWVLFGVVALFVLLFVLLMVACARGECD